MKLNYKYKLMIILVVIFGILILKNTNKVYGITPQQVNNNLQWIRYNTDGFKEGDTFWGSFQGASSCHGWALKVCQEVFGTNPNDGSGKWTDTEHPSISPNDLCIGDLLRYNSDWGVDHTIVVLGFDDQNIYYADCNWGANCTQATHPMKGCSICWNRYKSWSEMNRLMSLNCLEEGHEYQKGRIIHCTEIKSNEPPKITGFKIDTKSVTTDSVKLLIYATDDKGVSNVYVSGWRSGSDETAGIYKKKAGKSGDHWEVTISKTEIKQNPEGYLCCFRAYAEDGEGLDTNKYFDTNVCFGNKVTNLGNFIARIVPKANENYCIGVAEPTKDSLVLLKNKEKSDNTQLWRFEKQSDGFYKIINVISDMAMDIRGAKDENNTKVGLWTYSSTADHHKYMIQSYNGGYRIVPKHTGYLRGIDVTSGSFTNNNNIIIYDVGSATNKAQTFIFEKVAEGINISKTSADLYTGSTLNLSASVTPNDVKNKEINWKSSNTSVATVNSSGIVTGKSAGTVKITATTTDGTNLTKTCTVNVIEETYDSSAKLEINKSKYQFNELNKTFKLEAKLTNGKSTNILSWTSNNPEVATVNDEGVVTSKRGGFTYITAKSKYYGSISCWVYVGYPVTFSDGKQYAGDLDGNGRFDANDSAEILEIFKTNSNTEENKILGDLDGNGKVDANDASLVLDIFRSECFKIGNLATIRKVRMTYSNLEIIVGETKRNYASAYPSNTTEDTTLTWTSSNTNVASVDKSGNITGKTAGTATITAKTSKGKNASCKVTVVKSIPITDIKINKTNAKVFEKGTIILSSILSPTDTNMDKTVTWTSSNTKIATVNQNGKVKGVKEGVVTITAKTSNGKTANCKVSVIKKIPITSIKINKSTARVFINGKIILSSTIAPKDANINKTITWTSSNTKIATVDKNGKVIGKKAGVVNITAKTSNGKTDTCKVTVIKKIPITSIKLNKTTAKTFVNGKITLSVSINPTDANINKTITWTSSNTKVATVDKNGKVVGKKAGTAIITAKSSNGKTATCKVTVQNIIKPDVSYCTHVQDVGWQEFVKNGAMSGTEGRSLRLEAIRIKLENTNVSGGIEYRTHVQDIGWQNYVKDGADSGTEGRSLRLEAISIRLTGELANNFDIYYRVHCQDIGWMGWAKNGENAGTAGYSYRLEGINIVIVEKGGSVPGNTKDHYIEK